MRFFERIFKRPSFSDIKQLIDEVSEQNELYRGLYDQGLFLGQKIQKDYNMKGYIKDGYEKNGDVFAIIDRLSTMFSQIPLGIIKDEDIITEGSLNDRLRQPNNYQVIEEYLKLWYTFYLVSGNAITYAPLISGGNDKGQLMPGGMYMMPTQNVEIESGGWRDPVKNYVLDLNESEKIPAEDVMHVRMPNLQYQGGANFMGMSPIKVAALIIEAENQGYQTVADTLQKGIPPGILTKTDESYNEAETKVNQENLERAYLKKYGRQKITRRAGVPIVTSGKVEWLPMGFSNFKDLQILEMNQNGLRVLCNVYGVPSQAFNDTAASTFSNMSDARKMVYTNRLIPDMKLFLSHLNIHIVPGYGEDLKVKPNYSEIPELQSDKQKLSEWLLKAVQVGLPPNVMLEKLGLEQIDNPAMDRSYVPFNMTPIEDIGMDAITIEDAEKILRDEGIDDYKLTKVV